MLLAQFKAAILVEKRTGSVHSKQVQCESFTYVIWESPDSATLCPTRTPHASSVMILVYGQMTAKHRLP